MQTLGKDRSNRQQFSPNQIKLVKQRVFGFFYDIMLSIFIMMELFLAILQHCWKNSEERRMSAPLHVYTAIVLVCEKMDAMILLHFGFISQAQATNLKSMIPKVTRVHYYYKPNIVGEHATRP